ncbi:hypothetical protein [Nereida sp. MMG025]|uniref:hypothetical protein n=1 Tax=Nereida sp. MMG025 TaxID=2909981 RepID=UPI001F1682A8|nr:hypothetical protein [Nereida sp. MMG025]MCF6446165.1 hypothetical protein [Nereida sp. MMG025]
MDNDPQNDAPKDDFARFDCGNYTVVEGPKTDRELWDWTPPKRRYLLPPDFAERFGKPDSDA